ncbi:glutaredoxin family protein [Actinidia rufa]|uniref:Glutaredoxin family protein n=1 Tax=Actinidia rufa TaxID=165716 RepID=A0A7J0GZU8_9ERIC|nr:glutaredoxin family protein [Actinidia rufa]
MGCVSSTLLNTDDDFSQIGSSSLGHHIVSLTSTTYGLLTLDHPSSESPPTPTPTPPPPPRFTLGSLFPSPLSEPRSLHLEPPEVIHSWELMAGLDPITDSFRFSPLPQPPPKPKQHSSINNRNNKENANPNLPLRANDKSSVFKPLSDPIQVPSSAVKDSLDEFEKLCPTNGENRVVIYTTTLRGVRKTFEACNAVREAIQALGVMVCERDISMDSGFRQELRELMEGKESSQFVPPRVFVKGRYVGGAEEVLRMVEEGQLGELLQGLPKSRVGLVCEGCGGVRFLPCFSCNGSCKMVMVVKEELTQKHGQTVVVRCPDCNENGLVLCPICT